MQEIVDVLSEQIYQSAEFYKDGVSIELEVNAEKIVDGLQASDISPDALKALSDYMAELAEKYIDDKPILGIFVYSIALAVAPAPELLEKVIDYVIERADYFTKNNLHFYAYQFQCIAFRHKEADSPGVKLKIWKIYKEVYDRFEKEVTADLTPIPMDERNKNLVLVIAEQMLAIGHGPTKTTLDRCKTLITNYNKEVLLITTNEGTATAGKFPFCYGRYGHKSPEAANYDVLEWKGVKINNFYVDGEMPEIGIINELLKYIRKLAPSRIVVVGGTSVLANLADKMIPAIVVGLSPSQLEPTCVTYQTLGKKTDEEERYLIDNMGFSESHIVESIFTSGLKTQESTVTRAEFGIPEDAFVITIIGGRLEVEVDNDFLDMLTNIWQDDFFILFLGDFAMHEEKLERYEKIKNAYKLTRVSDILATLELCNLYVNPTRRGGGTSCVESMFKGIPVVTMAYGDVPANTGEDFIVADYDEMGKTILRYHDDPKFYKAKSEIAVKRAAVLLDTDGEFVRIMDEVERREKENKF